MSLHDDPTVKTISFDDPTVKGVVYFPPDDEPTQKSSLLTFEASPPPAIEDITFVEFDSIEPETRREEEWVVFAEEINDEATTDSKTTQSIDAFRMLPDLIDALPESLFNEPG